MLRKLAVSILLGLAVITFGCSSFHQIHAISPDGSRLLRIAQENRFGCGSDGCIAVYLSENGGKNEVLYQTDGWQTCFAIAAWTHDSKKVFFVAADCFGSGAVGFGFDVRTRRKLSLDSSSGILHKAIEDQYHVRPDSDLLLWSRSDAARIVFQRTNKTELNAVKPSK